MTKQSGKNPLHFEYTAIFNIHFWIMNVITFSFDYTVPVHILKSFPHAIKNAKSNIFEKKMLTLCKTS